jgi:hypothetical protein
MEKKILKYKYKKSKLEEKIFETLVQLKKKNNKQIFKSFENTDFITEIKDTTQLNSSPNPNNIHKKVFILISGIYSVGKTTFVKHLEEFICYNNTNTTITKFNITNELDIESINLHVNKYLDEKINICMIETESIFIKKIIDIISDNKIFIINLIPTDFHNYKKKLINKIFESTNTVPNTFEFEIYKLLDFIKQNKKDVQIESVKKNLSKNLDIVYKKLIKNDDEIFYDEDFNFLDDIILLLLDTNLLNNIDEFAENNDYIKNFYI